MTSLFDHVEPNELPVDLLNPGVRGVSLLEFMSVGAAEMEDAAAAAEDEAGAEEFTQDRGAQMRAMLDAAREDAAAETRKTLGTEYEARIGHERRRIERLLVEFAEQRQQYFTQVEAAVVRLALYVAAKVLHREVSVDAMHLAATVRVALSRIQDGSTAVMRVRPEEVGVWEQVFSEEGANRVEVAGDKAMRLGDCVLETTIGRVELGVVAQLGEIERGFRDLLEKAGH
jgi:flagellar assembly protein FliH